jgi:filamentous hemagglutinin
MSTPSQIGAIGEKELAQLGGEPQVQLRTTLGLRVVDRVVGFDAHEAKVGEVMLTTKVKSQILKDAELLREGHFQTYTWHFYRSPVTGKIGPNPDVAAALTRVGIRIELHK